MLEVGRVVKAHGLTGEVVVGLLTDRVERVAPGTVLDTDRGPLEIVAVRPYQGRWLVTFAGVVDRTGADRIRGLVLRAEPIDDPDAMWVHELIGADAVLPDGTVAGRVDAVQENPAADLLLLDTGALVPMRFVLGWDDARRVLIDPPEGLLELGDG